MQRVLGLDLGTRCGWAILQGTEGDYIAGGTWTLRRGADESGGMRIVRFESHLAELIAKNPRLVVAYEAVKRWRGSRAAIIYGELFGVVERLGLDHFDYVGFPPGRIKKEATGRGNSSKNMMQAAAAQRWPEVNIVDDNHADAMWIAHLAVQDFLS